MKDNLDYYSHFVNSHNHPKFKLLRSRYGWSGEGKFWALNNMIAQSSNCMLPINKKFIEADAAEVLDFTIDEFREYIRFLSYECELLINLDGILSSQIVRDTYSEVTKQRLAARERKIKKVSENETSPLILFNKT